MDIWIIDSDVMELAYFIYLRIKCLPAVLLIIIGNKWPVLPIILTQFHRKIVTIPSLL